MLIPRGDAKCNKRLNFIRLDIGARAKCRVERFHNIACRSAFNPVPDGLAVTAPGNQPVFSEKGQMLGYRRVSNSQKFGKLTNRLFSFHQLAQDQQPVTVRHRLEKFASLIGS